MDRFPSWETRGRFLAGAVAAGLITFVAILNGGRVPVLRSVDLVIHEVGHLVTAFLPEVWSAMAGSIAQLMVPAAIAVYFFFRGRDLVGGGLALAWVGAGLADIGAQISDAPYEQLRPLFPGARHDWAFILGPDGFQALDLAMSLGESLATASILVAGAAVAVCLLGPLVSFNGRDSRVPVVPAPVATPVPEPDPQRPPHEPVPAVTTESMNGSRYLTEMGLVRVPTRRRSRR